MKRLKNKVVIITGGAGGIGAAASEIFAAEGASVVIADLSEKMGRSLQAKITADGGVCTFLQCDVSQSADVRSVIDFCKNRLGALDVIYNNASVFLSKLDGRVTEIEEAVWEKVIAVNLRSVYLFSKYGIPLMMEKGGSIINTASSAGVIGIPNCDAYTASKGATVQLTKSMAVEYGRYGIRINCIAPAAIMTPMVKESNPSDGSDVFDERAFLNLRTPLRRYGAPEEIARVALFLASDESSYLNGSIIVADGGITVCGDLSKVSE